MSSIIDPTHVKSKLPFLFNELLANWILNYFNHFYHFETK